MNLLTRYIAVPIGANILGLLSVFAVIGGTFLPLAYADSLPRIMHRSVVLIPVALTIVSVIAFDLWWRLTQFSPDRWDRSLERWDRLLFPICGGCFLFVPIWLFLSVGTLGPVLFGLIYTLIAKLQ